MSENFVAAPYVRENPRISYVEPEDPWYTRKLVSSLEVIMGRNKLEKLYQKLKSKPFDLHRFFEEALELANISVEFDKKQLAKIPQKGPLVFVANHPFGVIDGIILCQLAVQSRGDFRILLNSLLCQDKDLAPYFLPIDFAENKQAVKTNIMSKRAAKECLEQQIPVLIFPSGMVSTANKFGLGEVVDAPWSTFAAKLVKESNATVVPIHFYGQNSRKFHVASHIALPLRMALLVNEALNRFNSKVELTIGDPIQWTQMESMQKRQELTDFLYAKVQETGQR
jgi:putative hemolysin